MSTKKGWRGGEQISYLTCARCCGSETGPSNPSRTHLASLFCGCSAFGTKGCGTHQCTAASCPLHVPYPRCPPPTRAIRIQGNAACSTHTAFCVMANRPRACSTVDLLVGSAHAGEPHKRVHTTPAAADRGIEQASKLCVFCSPPLL